MRKIKYKHAKRTSEDALYTGDGIRTHDLVCIKDELYPLSYTKNILVKNNENVKKGERSRCSLKDILSSFRKMKFSKEKFKKNAPKGIQKQLKDHLDALDGLEVIFDERFGRDGYIPQYFKDGTEYYLYPVYKTWCTEVRS